MSSLLWIVGGISKNLWVDLLFDPVITCNDNSIYHGVDKVVIQHILLDHLHELTPAMSHELVALGLPVWVPTCNPTFKLVWKLWRMLMEGQTANSSDVYMKVSKGIQEMLRRGSSRMNSS